jgi:hypothetical protein
MVLLYENATLCVKYLEECWVNAKKKPLESIIAKVLWPMLIRGGRLSFLKKFIIICSEIWLYFIGQPIQDALKKNVKIVNALQ